MSATPIRIPKKLPIAADFEPLAGCIVCPFELRVTEPKQKEVFFYIVLFYGRGMDRTTINRMVCVAMNNKFVVKEEKIWWRRQ